MTYLVVQADSVGDPSAQYLAKMLKSNATVTRLDLSFNKIGDAGANGLADMLTINSTLTHLSCTGNGIGCKGASAIARSLHGNTSLTTLEPGNGGGLWRWKSLRNRIGIDGATAFADLLITSTSLKELDLEGSQLKDMAALLRDALKVNVSLTKLNLGGNNLEAKGAAYIAEALALNTSRTSIDLGFNAIGNKGAQMLSKVFVEDSWITIPSFGVGAWSPPEALTETNWRKMSLGDEECWVPTSAPQMDKAQYGHGDKPPLRVLVGKNETLRLLNVESNGISAMGISHLANALAANSSLTKLVLTHNNASSGLCTPN